MCPVLLYWRVGLALATGVWGWPLLGWEKTAVIGWSGRRGVAGVGWGGQWAMKVQNLRNFFSRAERPATGPNLP